MIYIPNTYDMNSINSQFSDEVEFLNWQYHYKRNVETYLNKLLKINDIEKYITQSSVNIPRVDDSYVNFYHNTDVFNSGYLFLRNNIHIERLSPEQLAYLKGNTILSEEFLKSTIGTVLFEDGDVTFFGPAMNETAAKSQSIVFEFAYDQKQVETIDQLKQIKQVIDTSFSMLDENNKDVNISISKLVYKDVSNFFNKEDTKIL